MRVAIVGCGYVGKAVGQALVQRGHDVIGTTTRIEQCASIEALGVTPAVLELGHHERLEAVLKDRETVLMMIAPSRSGASHRSVYLEGMRSLLTVLPETRVRHVLYTSSTSVYGQLDGSWVDEDSPTEPESENGQVLVQTERELSERAAVMGVTVAIVRLAGIIGPGRGPANRVPAWAGTVRDDGCGWINLIHRDDIVTACVRLSESARAEVLNLSDGCPVQRRDYYDRVLQVTGHPLIRWVEPAVGPVDFGKRVRNDRLAARLRMTFRHAADVSIAELASSPGSDQAA